MSRVKRIKVTHEAGKAMSSAGAFHDITKHIQDLPTDVFRHCLEFVGKGNFAFVAPVSKHFYWNYINLGVEMKNNVIDVDVILQQCRNKRTTAEDVAKGSLRLATECFLKTPKEFHQEVYRQAILNGRLDILKCAAAFGINLDSLFDQYHEYEDVLYETIAHGHLDVIEFLHEQGEDFDNDDIVILVGIKKGTAKNLHILRTKGIISSFDFNIFNYLVRDGEFDILRECYEDSLIEVNENTFRYCAESGSIDVMNWLLQQYECVWTSNMFKSAAKSGSIPMMELCLQYGCPTDADVSFYAMDNKNKEEAFSALKWLRKHNVPWNEYVCKYAAILGNLEALKWARENGCPWDTKTYNCAAMYGNIDILDYCYDHNCPLDLESVYEDVLDEFYDLTWSEMEDRRLKVFKWFYQHSIPWNASASLSLATSRHLETLTWAIENGCPWHEEILEEALGRKDVFMVEYCLQHHSPIDETIYVLALDKMNEHELKNPKTDAKMIEMLQMFHDYGIPLSREIIPHVESLGRSNVANWLRCIGCPE